MNVTWWRRPLTVTGWLILSSLALLCSPLILLAGAVAGRFTGDRKPQIMARLILVYFGRELVTLLACGALWLLAGAGLYLRSRPLQRLHWRLLRWFVRGIAGAALEGLDIDVATEHSDEAAQALRSDGPLIMFSRHAGPGDTVLLVDTLLTQYDRRPSVVFKEALTLDPSVDLISHRLPHAVLDTDDRVECEARIETAAGQLGSRGVLLIFPEGGNFSHQRRRQVLRGLRRKGKHDAADTAAELDHTLPPRPSGALAALRASPQADIVFGAHTGLGLAAYPRELWRELPVGGTLQTRVWYVPRAEVPTDPDEQFRWLTDWWKRIDDWVGEQRSEPEPAEAEAEARAATAQD